MAGGKRLVVSEDTQIHMTTTYSRKKKGREKEKRVFNFVVKGLLISTTLVGSLLTTGFQAFANEPSSQPSTPTTPIVNTINGEDAYYDEVAMISNLKMANKVLSAAIESGQLSSTMYDNVMKRLVAIDTKLTVDSEFNKTAELLPILEQTDVLLKAKSSSTDKDIIAKRESSIKALESIQSKLGVKSEAIEYDITQTSDEKVVDEPTVEEQPTVAPTESKARMANTPTSEVQAVKASNAGYNDFNSSSYWANDMVWSIDKGIIQGYKNTVHPSDKSAGVGNWLAPHDALIESQALAVVLRYTHRDELAKTSPQIKDWWASTSYQLASKYKLPTKGSISNRGASNTVMTRGALAEVLATIHFGQKVTQDQAIKFMYDTGVSQGKEASKGATKENFGVNDTLQRAHIASFMKRYNDFVVSGNKVTMAGSVVQAPSSNTGTVIKQPSIQAVNGIKVNYGKHTYESANQAQYDKVMSEIKKAIDADYASIGFTGDAERAPYYEEFINGARGTMDRTSPDFRTFRNSALLGAEGRIGELVAEGLTKDQILKMVKASSIASDLFGGSELPPDSSPRSAYDAIVRNLADCDSIANTYSAVYDALGYNTAIIAVPGHASVIVQLPNGKWVEPAAGGFALVDVSSALAGGTFVHTQPTNGTLLK